jgi:amphi-Trp domain-containing protein
MADETLFESERRRSRADIAAVFRSLATALENDGPVTLEDGARSVAIDPPEQPVFEIEVERDADGMSLELELEWNEQENSSTAANAGVDDAIEETVQSLGRFELFLDRAEEWRWRLVHRNGNIIATSGEGYTSKQNALKGIRSVMRNAPDAEVVSE